MGLFSRKGKSNSTRVYLDWASAAPVSVAAHKAFIETLDTYGNPSSPHEEGRKAKEVLEDARSRIAKLCGVKAASVVFTSGATEANALALQGRVRGVEATGLAHRQAGTEQKGMERREMHMLYLPTMHSSVLKTVEELKKTGVQAEPIPLHQINAQGINTSNWQINIPAFIALLRPETILVACDAVCGETGNRYDTRALRTAIDKAGYAGTALLHIDASQLPLVEIIERTRLGADLMTLDASKVGAVRGIGALIAAQTRTIAPVVFGGGQEQGLRSGTESPALATSFATALEEARAHHEDFSKRALELRTALLAQLTDSSSGVPNLVINTGKHSAPHILNISLLGRDTDYLVMLLDAAGYSVSTKSACETDTDNGSTVVFTLSGDQARAASTLRISFGPTTTPREVASFGKELIRSVTFLDHSH
ncbi:MAG: Cysteine desulfurase [Parcubacteria group bacterium]|nr:Cysteine desulfurase [Parcubacteria group bacterium]